MVRLKVISFRKIKFNIIKFVFVLFFIFLSFSVIKKVNISKNLDNIKIFPKLNYKVILGDSFIFFSGINIEKTSLEEITEKKKESNSFLFDLLKNDMGVISLAYDDLEIEKVNYGKINEGKEGKEEKEENKLNNKNDENKEKQNLINTLNLDKKDEDILNSNYVYVYDNSYYLPIKNSNDIFDVDLKNLSRKCETKIVEEKNKVDKYNVTIGNVKIRNESKYNIDENVLAFDFKLNNKKDVVIYHTHTCESYTPTEKYNYVQTGNYRSTDLSYAVARVGDVLEVFLTRMGYSVNHSREYHDYPAYNGSYNRALKTVESILKTNTSDIVLDIHRDAIGGIGEYGPCIEINGERVAQIMFVIGTDGGGLKHNAWKENLKFAVELYAKAEEMYPGFFKPIIVRNARYNQHVRRGAIITEIGATGNTLEEAENSMKYFCLVLDEYIKSK